MTELKKCFIFDIDGTLANCQHRVHHVNGSRKNWPAFFAGVPDDTPYQEVVMINRLLKSVHKDTPIFLCSGRGEESREATEAWLKKYEVMYDKLYMRPANNFIADHIVKQEMLDAIRADGYDPFLVFDDRQLVVDMWRRNGLFVLQCDPHANYTHHDEYEFHESIQWPLTILVGPSGAGKSTWIQEYKDEYPNNVISSDDIRQMLTGDFQDQSKNDKVFEAMHSIADTKLKRGLPVTLDATHIKNADRIKAAKLVPEGVPVRYVVLNRSVEAKTKTGGWRNSVSVKGKPLIEQHDNTFKSNIKAILSGDGLPNVTVFDLRIDK